jgi:hypothetical protein
MRGLIAIPLMRIFSMPHALPLRPNLLDAISNSMRNGRGYLFPESVILNVGNGMGQNQQAAYLGTSSAAFVIGHIGYLPM